MSRVLVWHQLSKEVSSEGVFIGTLMRGGILDVVVCMWSNGYAISFGGSAADATNWFTKVDNKH